MSNRIHLLARSAEGNLSGLIRDIKSYTSKQFTSILQDKQESRADWMLKVFEYHGKYKKGQTQQIWTHENHAEHVFSQQFIEQKLNYIHQNPVRAGIVEHPEDYLYSSARNYADMDSLIDVIKLDVLWKTVH